MQKHYKIFWSVDKKSFNIDKAWIYLYLKVFKTIFWAGHNYLAYRFSISSPWKFSYLNKKSTIYHVTTFIIIINIKKIKKIMWYLKIGHEWHLTDFKILTCLLRRHYYIIKLSVLLFLYNTKLYSDVLIVFI